MKHSLLPGFCMLVLLASPASADAPVLQSGVWILDGGSPLSVARHAAPEVVDWDNDGRKDLLVGQFIDGKINYFRNVGTDASPSFNGSTFLQSSGSDISVPHG